MAHISLFSSLFPCVLSKIIKGLQGNKTIVGGVYLFFLNDNMKISQKPQVGVSWQRKQKGQFFTPNLMNQCSIYFFKVGNAIVSSLKLLVLLTYLCEMRSSILLSSACCCCCCCCCCCVNVPPTVKVIWRWNHSQQPGEAGVRTCDPWFIRQAVFPLHHGNF